MNENDHFDETFKRFKRTYGDRGDIVRFGTGSYDTTPNVPSSPPEPCLVAYVGEDFDLASLPRQFGPYWVMANYGDHSSHPTGEPVD
jgi:signal peptidase I